MQRLGARAWMAALLAMLLACASTKKPPMNHYRDTHEVMGGGEGHNDTPLPVTNHYRDTHEVMGGGEGHNDTPLPVTNRCPDAHEVMVRIAAAIEALGQSHPALAQFRAATAWRGDFLVYENDVVDEPDPRYEERLRAFEKRLAGTRMASSRIAAERPQPTQRRFGPQGVRLLFRFDSGPARDDFPLFVPPERRFGDAQISLMEIDGPPTEGFRALDAALRALVRDEIARFRRECGEPESAG